MMKKWCWILICSILLSGCGKNSKEGPSEAIPVKVLVAATSCKVNAQNYVGTVKEDYASSLSFAVPGNVERIYVEEGDFVNKGKLLAEINSSNLQSTYAAAAAILRQAEDAFGRMKQLYEKGSLPEIQWVEMQTNLEKAKSAEKIARENLEAAKLYAPFSGLIGRRSVEPGVNVMPGIQAFTLLNMDKVKVNVAIPENLISSIKTGQAANIVIPALSDASLHGKVGKKGVVANVISHSYEVEIPILNPQKNLIPGMVCKVQLLSGDSEHSIVLPNRAVMLSSEGEHFVWLAVKDTAHKRMVQTAGLSEQGIIITDGIAIGDKVIVEGYQKVSDGTKIIIR
jgi:membrane fusion protein, multidrug efflux system